MNSRVDINGQNFPAGHTVRLSIFGKAPRVTEVLDDVGTVPTDDCGKFDVYWPVPNSLIAAGYTVVTVEATTTDPPSSRAVASLDIRAGK
jgi:hypothetical protein